MGKNWTIDSIVSKIIEIEGKGGDKQDDIVDNFKQRLKIAVSSVENKKVRIDVDGSSGKLYEVKTLLKNDEVQAKISGFFEKYEKRPYDTNQKGGSGECCYFLFLCFFFSIWFNNMSTLQGQCASGDTIACRHVEMAANNFADDFLFMHILGNSGEGGGRKRKRTKKKKRRKKKKGTKKRR